MSSDTPDVPPDGPWGRAPSSADFAEAGLDKARAFLAARNADAAIREAEKVFAQDPNGAFGFQALDIIGDAHTQKGDYETVMKIGRELLSIDPERVDGYLHLARGALERDDMRTSIDAIERGLSRHPNSLTLTLLNSYRFRHSHDNMRAIEWGEKAVAMAPWYAGALNTLGFAYAQADRPDDAKRVFDEARALDPLSANTVSTSAAIAFSNNRFNDALDLAVQALALDPQDDDAHHIAYRARWFRSPLMKPYWALISLTTLKAVFLGLGFFVLLIVLTPTGLGRLVVPIVIIYYLACLFVVLLVQALDDPKRRKKKKKPTLKNY